MQEVAAYLRCGQPVLALLLAMVFVVALSALIIAISAHAEPSIATTIAISFPYENATSATPMVTSASHRCAKGWAQFAENCYRVRNI